MVAIGSGVAVAVAVAVAVPLSVAVPPPASSDGVVAVGGGAVLGGSLAVTVEDGTSLVYRVLQGDARSRTIGITVPVNGTRWLTSRTTMELELVADSGQDLTVCAP